MSQPHPNGKPRALGCVHTRVSFSLSAGVCPLLLLVPSRKEGRLPGGPRDPQRPERRLAVEPSGSELVADAWASHIPWLVFSPSGVVPAQGWDPLCP